MSLVNLRSLDCEDNLRLNSEMYNYFGCFLLDYIRLLNTPFMGLFFNQNILQSYSSFDNDLDFKFNHKTHLFWGRKLCEIKDFTAQIKL